jgi:hypothetical protein
MSDQLGKKFSVVTIAGEDKAAELDNFARFIGLEAAASGRYSLLLVLQLFRGVASQTLNPAKVVREIETLEGRGAPSITKPPSLFKHPPLKGLWHKHYFADGLSTMAVNLRNALHDYGMPWFEQRVREAEQSGEKRLVTQEDISAIVHDVVIGHWTRRANAAEVTGEWLIYAEHDGAKYYLAIGFHNEDHAHLRAQIDTVCCAEYPFLKDLLDNA